ncbi:hypothetical protein [Mesorhizobium sp. B2-8-5]|nr:hypothetical protein [Mesorhizobium sp. B2-8-5]
MDELAEPRAFGLLMAFAAAKAAAGIVTPPLLPPRQASIWLRLTC